MRLERRAWDSTFFGFGVSHLHLDDGEEPKTSAIDAAAVGQRARLVQACPTIGQRNQINALEEAGFHFADLRVELELQVTSSTLVEQTEVREAAPAGLDDIDSLQAIARRIYRHSRFRVRGLDGRKADELYSTWVAQAVKGRFDDCCQIIRLDGVPVGFVTLRFDTGSKKAHISLLGVSPRSQGDGVGRKLVQWAITATAERDLTRLGTTTQGENNEALRFYQRCGFKVAKLSSWYYKLYEQGR